MFTRRRLCEAAALLAGAGAVSGRAQAAAIPEAPTTGTNTMQPPLVPASGPHYQPVVTLNGWTLPWRMNGDWKEFHLVAEPVEREFAPGMTVHLWGYNGQSPGPTIECVEGDKVRIFVTNKLPEHTSRSRISSPARPSSTSSSSRQAAPSCTIRTPTKWCRWAWA